MRNFNQRAIVVALLIFLSTVVYLSLKLSEDSKLLAAYGECNCPKLSEKKTDRHQHQRDRNELNQGDRHRLCIVVPFRNRFEELLDMVPHMNKFLNLNRRVDEYRILVIDQIDRYRFNRASLVNVGFYESRRLDCDYLAMHDVDLLPLNQELDYGYPREGPYHVSAPKYHPRYHYKTFIGGILLIRLDHFLRINGMSNRYWGWGLEDDEFYLRLRAGNLTIVRPKGLSTNSSSTFRHVHESAKRPRDMTFIGDQEKETKKRDKVTGVKSVEYKVISRTNLTIDDDGPPCLIVRVKLICDKRLTPWCEHEED